jgi:dsDNA-specific endonuclease/ATPase MutS2
MSDDDDGDGDEPEAVTEPPLTDVLDLHHFVPREVADLVTEYVHAAHAAGMRHVKLIHGKGIGALRRTVHAALDRHPLVVSYRLGDERSGWGATLVDLVD